MHLSLKRKKKDKTTAKIKVVNVYSIGKYKILNDYLERNEAIEAKKRLTYELLYYKNKRKINHRATFRKK